MISSCILLGIDEFSFVMAGVLKMDQERYKFQGAIVFVADKSSNQCVFVSRKSSPQFLGGMAGGKIEAHETFRQAAQREFMEETGFALSALSSEPIFSSKVYESNSFCQVFLGCVDDEHFWDRLKASKNGFIGPEGLIVRAAEWHRLMDYGECEFAHFNNRFLREIARDANMRGIFEQFQLNNVHSEISKFPFPYHPE